MDFFYTQDIDANTFGSWAHGIVKAGAIKLYLSADGSTNILARKSVRKYISGHNVTCIMDTEPLPILYKHKVGLSNPRM